MSTEGNTDSGRVLRELSAGRLKDFRKPLAPASSTQQNRVPSVVSENDLPTVSSIDPNDENLMMSTRHNFDDDSHLLPKLRTTAQNYRFYNPPEPQQNVPTSAVNRAFQDFDNNIGSSDDDSIEVGRGYGRNNRGTPSKLGSSDIIMQLGDSFYEVGSTPKARSDKRKTQPEHSSLRRELLRRASGAPQEDMERRSNASPRAARAGAPSSVKSTRFRNASNDPGDTTGYGRAASEPPFESVDTRNATPKRPTLGTPRSAGQVNNATARSFVLPDVSDLTEFLGGTAEIEPLKGRSAKDKSRFAANTPRRAPAQPTHIQVEQVPVPEEEQDLAKALEDLKEKVCELEKYKHLAEGKMMDYESEIVDLRAELAAQRSQSKRGSTQDSADPSGPSNAQWRIEKTKLEASVHTLQTRLERTERKLTTSETTLKRVSEEREAAVAQFEIASRNAQELEDEFVALQEQHGALQDQVKKLKSENKKLRLENDELKAELDNAHDRHEEDTLRWTRKEAELARKAAMTDRAVVVENDELRARVGELEDALNEQTQQLPKLEAQAYRKAEKEAKAKQSEMIEENQRLQNELAEAKSVREQEIKRWAREETDLKAKIARQEDTMQNFTDAAVKDAVDLQMREEIKRLKAELKQAKAQRIIDDEPSVREVDLQDELDRVIAQHEEDSLRWKAREEQLREQLQRMTGRNFTTRTGRAGATVTDRAKSLRSDTVETRPRSKSRTRLQSQPNSGTKADSYTGAEVIDISDGESTTDLDLGVLARAKERRLSNKYDRNSGAQTSTWRKDDFDKSQAKQSSKVEHKRRAVSAYEPLQRESTINRRTSTKDLTGRSLGSGPMELVGDDSECSIPERLGNIDGADAADATGTHRSNVSVHRRRRSSQPSFKEMTSAFIIPDITLHNGSDDAQKPSSAAHHDIKSCTICQRVLSSHPRDTASTLTLKLSAVLPVSSRPELTSDPDATQRPTQSPILALAAVLKALYDEYAHYQLQLSAAQKELQNLDPAASRRKRTAAHDKVAHVNEMLAAKGAQIYALFDVVEAHKDELNGTADIDDEELSRVVEEIRNGKKVGFANTERDADGTADAGTARDAGRQPTVEDDDDESDNDAPWEGIVTETIDVGGANRGGA